MANLGGARTDGTVGAKQSFTGHFTVPAAAGEQRGGNLFHSFSTFDIAPGESATFTGPASVHNVLVRVTGGTASTIDGALGCSIPNADLYLLNPAGVAFGPGASLDVKGSFAVSTASYLRLADGSRFAAAPGTTTTLRAARPEAFGFLGARVATVTFVGRNHYEQANYDGPLVLDRVALAVPAGRTFAVVAGAIDVSGTTLRAPSGVLSIAAMGSSSGEHAVGGSGVPSLPAADVSAGGSVIVRDAGELDVRGRVAGRVSISGGNVTLRRGFIQARTTQGNGGGVAIVASGNIAVVREGEIFAVSRDADTGRAGDVRLVAGADVQVVDGGIFAGTSSYLKDASGARGGDVTVVAGRDLFAENGGITSNSGLGGPAGNVTLRAGRVLTIDGSSVATSSDGIPTSRGSPAGDVKLIAGADMIVKGSATVDAGTDTSAEAGHVRVQTGGRLLLNAASSIYAGTTQGSGAAGSIAIRAGKGVSLAGGSFIYVNASGAFSKTSGSDRAGSVDVWTGGDIDLADSSSIQTATAGEGRGGDLNVRAGNDVVIGSGSSFNAATDGRGRGGDVRVRLGGMLRISGGGFIDAGTGSNGRKGGDGGNVRIAAGSVEVRGEGGATSGVRTGIFADSFAGDGIFQASDAPAGSIMIRSRSLIDVSERGQISVDSRSPTRPGGDLSLVAGTSIRVDGASITARALKDGANVSLSAPLSVALTGRSTVSTQSAGNGGNISIDPLVFKVAARSGLNANGGVNGGNVTVRATATPGLRLSGPGANVTATGATGLAGSVATGPATTDVTNAIPRLPAALFSTAAALQARCGEDASFNSFVFTGMGGLSLDPQSWWSDNAGGGVP